MKFPTLLLSLVLWAGIPFYLRGAPPRPTPEVRVVPSARTSAPAGSPLTWSRFRPERAKWSLLLPSDLGPQTLDVRGYPKDYQRIYKTMIPERCLRCHTAARIWNSPVVQLDGAVLAREERARPRLYRTGNLLRAEPEYWIRYVKRMRQMPVCCGGCSDMSDGEARDITRFLIYDSLRRKTGAAAPAFAGLRRRLIAEFVRLKPEDRGDYAADLSPKDPTPTR